MNKNYLQAKNPQDLRKIASINFAIDTAYNETNHYISPKDLQAIKDFIIEKSVFENYGKQENLNPRDNYYFSKNVFEMVKKYPLKCLSNIRVMLLRLCYQVSKFKRGYSGCYKKRVGITLV